MPPPPNYLKSLEGLKSWSEAHRVPIISALNAVAILLGASLIAVFSMGHDKFVAEAQSNAAQIQSPQSSEISASQETPVKKQKAGAASPEKRGTAPVSSTRVPRASQRVKPAVKAQAPSRTPAPPPPPPPVRTRLPGQPPFDRTDLPAEDSTDDSTSPDEPSDDPTEGQE